MPIERRDVLAEVNRASWYHRFEIVPGVFTPGQCPVDPRAVFDELGLARDLTGQRVLEVGTWDGPYAFELEARGADVVATDIQDPDHTGFNTARRILRSKVEYVRTSVYDLPRAVAGEFDVVVFLGVYYHLKNPIQAFEAVSAVLKTGGVLLFEGEALLHYAETLGRKGYWNRLVLAVLANSDVPVTLCYPNHYKGAPNWFVPNRACLESWLKAAGLEVRTFHSSCRPPLPGRPGLLARLKHALRPWYHLLTCRTQRVYGTAVKKEAATILEHQVYGQDWKNTGHLLPHELKQPTAPRRATPPAA